MLRRFPKIVLPILGALPMVVFAAHSTSQEPKCEDVYKNIKVFKGVPASDLIASMEFMSASLGYKCTDCHDAADYAKDTPTLETAREMVLMQREINTKYFDGRLETTCMTCHNGKEHPVLNASPANVPLRHKRMETTPKAADIFAKHTAAAGKDVPLMTRTGTLTAPNDVNHKEETNPLELVQAPGGKYRLLSATRVVGSDGAKSWYGPYPVTDEPAAIFGRMGRTWTGTNAFDGLERMVVTGQDTIGTTEVVVVRASRPKTLSNEELYFDSKTGLLVRLVNIRPTTIGTVISTMDFSNYKDVNGTQVPMKVVTTFATGDKWIMEFKEAKVGTSADPSMFVPPAGG